MNDMHGRKDNNPLITVLILNFNGLDYLEKTLPSTLSIDYPNYEIVLVDNASNDGSLEFIQKYKKIRVIQNKENLGVSGGRNVGVENSRGEYILSLDEDIIVPKECLNELLKFYNSQDNLAFLSFPLAEDGRDLTSHYGFFCNSVKKLVGIDSLRKIKSFPIGGFVGGAVFFRRDIFEKLGGYDSKYPFHIDDLDLSIKAYNYGYKVMLFTDLVGTHIGIQRREESKSWCWKNKYYLSGIVRTAIKNYRMINLLMWLPILYMWVFIKSLAKSFKFFSFCPLLSYYTSFYYTMRDFKDTLKQRIIIQKERVSKKDIFLHIKSPF